MFQIRLICMGKLKEKFYLSAADEYAKRLRAFCEFQLIELPARRELLTLALTSREEEASRWEKIRPLLRRGAKG